MIIRVSFVASIPFLLANLLLPVGSAQNPEVLDFNIVPLEGSFKWVSFGQSGVGSNGEELSSKAEFPFEIHDKSVNIPPPAFRRIEMEHEWLGGTPPDEYWFDLSSVSDFSSVQAAQKVPGRIEIFHTAATRALQGTIKLTVNLSLENRPEMYVVKSELFTARIHPSFGLEVSLLVSDPRFPYTAQPDSLVTIPIQIYNLDLYQHRFDVSITLQPSESFDVGNVPAPESRSVLLEPLERKTLNLTFRTPKDRMWFNSESLGYVVNARIAEGPGVSQQTVGTLIIQGFYYSTPMKVGIFLAPVLLCLVLFVIIRSRRYYDEHVLGRPIPAWKIPEEARQLETLRRDNPRVFFETRHFLMVQEHASALMWFYAYKRENKKGIRLAARDDRLLAAAERLDSPDTSQFDRRAERLKRRIHRRQERARKKAEFKTEKLQSKLDRRYDKHFQKDHGDWERKVEKLQKKHNKPYLKAKQMWEKEVEQILDGWEKPFRKEKEKHAKATRKALDAHEAIVKKEDKETWKAWRALAKENEIENKIRRKEGKEPSLAPQLVSHVVGPPDLPPPFETPPKPMLPPEPKPKDVELPKEPQPTTPVLAESRYAKKARRRQRKGELKSKRLGRKLDRKLARNERDRIRFIAKIDSKRRKLLKKAKRLETPGIWARLPLASPEHATARNARNAAKAIARDHLDSIKEAERLRLETLQAQAERSEAELLEKVARNRALLRRDTNTLAGENLKADLHRDEVQLRQLRSENRQRMQNEASASEARLKAERDRMLAESSQMAETSKKDNAPADAPALSKRAARSKE